MGSRAPVASTRTLIDAFRRHRLRAPKKNAFLFLADAVEETERLTYATLDRKASALAARLDRAGLRQRPVLLIHPPGLDFVVALLGCLMAGAIAVPVPFLVRNRAGERIAGIAEDAQPAAVLTLQVLIDDRARALDLPSLADVPWIATDAVAEDEADGVLDGPAPEEIALIQYTSGSTSSPKGVVITHANLAHNQRMIAEAYGHGEDTVVVNWVPPHHDMGLIGGIFQPLHCGASCILLPPLKVLQHPIRWLQAISKYRGNSSPAPTFGFEACVGRIATEAHVGLDLSSWNVAICGAEPVRAAVLDEFSKTFSAVGFQRSAFRPAYGLAEATLMAASAPGGGNFASRTVDLAQLSQNRVAAPAAGAAKSLVSCGYSSADQEIAIVDPITCRRLAAEGIGEIWISGGSVGQGYWNRPEESERIFQARIEGDDRHWLRTGDLGFLGPEGLFVTGRLKDMLIIRGRNYYPQDIEEAVRCVPALESGQGAAFGIEIEGEEVAVLVFEPPRSSMREALRPEIAEAAMAAIARRCGLRLHDLVMLRPGGLPRTTSGKIRRSQCGLLYRTGALPVLRRGEWGARRAPVDALAHVDALLEGIE